ncbi:hypothetical protein COOONC_26474 [Cooperia oncophora]
MQPELCIQIQHGNHRIHYLRIVLGPLILRCRRETLYFTRNTITKVQYQKRCPHMGTCTGLKCAKITFSTLVSELHEANNYTGITYCSESCGGLGCSCGYPSSGCLFYRIYHVPVDDDIYEVFQCPSWFETISLQVELHDPKHRSYTFELKPYTTKQINNVSIEVTSFSFTPISLLNQRFFTNNNYACSSDPRHTNHTHNHTNCIIKDTCHCNPAEDSVSCYCTNNNVSRLAQLQNTFPLPIQEGLVSVQGMNSVPTISTRVVSVQTAITFDHALQEITQEFQNFQCRILPQQLLGCYNCVKGSIATLFCESDVMHATAQITCGLQQFTLSCTKQGTHNQVLLFFNKARVYETCRAQCGTYITIFELQGTLNYVNGFKPLWNYHSLLDTKYFYRLLPLILNSHFQTYHTSSIPASNSLFTV